MKEVKTKTQFCLAIKFQIMILIWWWQARFSPCMTVHFDATVPPTAMLHLQNRCICTCTTTIRLDIEHEKKISHNHKVSSNVEFPALLSFASRKGKWLSIVVFELKRPPDVLQNAPPNVGNLMWSRYSVFRVRKVHSLCGTQDRRECTQCLFSPKHQGKCYL